MNAGTHFVGNCLIERSDRTAWSCPVSLERFLPAARGSREPLLPLLLPSPLPVELTRNTDPHREKQPSPSVKIKFRKRFVRGYHLFTKRNCVTSFAFRGKSTIVCSSSTGLGIIRILNGMPIPMPEICTLIENHFPESVNFFFEMEFFFFLKEISR